MPKEIKALVDDAFAEEIRRNLYHKNSTLKDAIVQGLRKWMDDAVALPVIRGEAPPSTNLTPDEARLTGALIEMLRAEDEELLPVVVHNLRLWMKKNANRKQVKQA